jgi:hypothetical protein
VKKNKSNIPSAALMARCIVLAMIASVTLIVVVTLVVSGPVAVVPVLAASTHAWTKLVKLSALTNDGGHQISTGGHPRLGGKIKGR